MNLWQFDDEPINIGVDIGWSEKKKSCAVAVEGLMRCNRAAQWKTYEGGQRPVAVGLFRYSDLLPTMKNLIESLGDRRRMTTVVVDGPIGAVNGLATQNRWVDNEFTRGMFNRRMQPSPVSSGNGMLYAEVTDNLVRVLYEAANEPYQPAWWDGFPLHGFTLCETHPTVGLALLLPPQELLSLPSRKTPRKLFRNSNRPFIRAKSDWYWQIGACRVVAEILACASVADEMQHERVAGLYCLAVANQLALHRTAAPSAVAIGNNEGVYVLPAVVDREWEEALGEVGIHAGELEPCDHSVYLISSLPERAVIAPSAVEQDISDADDAEKGDAATLILNDNGGIWEAHNDWLTGLEGPVYIGTDDTLEETVCLEKAGGEGQWTVRDRDKRPLKLAKRRGFTNAHPSKSKAWAIPVVLTDCPCMPVA